MTALKSGSIVHQLNLPRQTGNLLHCLLASHEVENPMHLHSQTCLVTGHFGSFIPSVLELYECASQDFSHSPPWNLVIINSGNISPFFDTFLPFVFPLFTDCLVCMYVCVLPWWFSGKESACNAGEVGLIPGSGRSLGEGIGNPLQYSCLGNPMDREAWRAIVHGVTKSQTQLDRNCVFVFYSVLTKFSKVVFIIIIQITKWRILG